MIKLSKQVNIRVTESDLQAARAEAKRLQISLAQLNRILLRAAGRRWLDVRDYMTEPKPSINLTPTGASPGGHGTTAAPTPTDPGTSALR